LKIKSTFIGANKALIKKIQKGISNQVKENDWYTSYSQDFSVYDKVYDGSYIVAGIVDKITLGINSGRDIEDPVLKEAVKMVKIGFIAKSLAKYGNAFLEISRNKKGEIQAIYPVAAKSIKQIKGGGFVQENGTEKSFFNAFTPFDQWAEKIAIHATSGAGAWELRYNAGEKSCGFNPNLTEILHIKLEESDDIRWGKSLFYPVLMQVLILKQIDQYYTGYFDNGLIQQKILNDESGMTAEEDLEALKERFQQEAKGVENAHSTMIFPGKISVTNLSDEINTEAFLNYRQHLQKSIAMRFQIPYDLLDTTDSNKASSTTALSAFYKNTVFPLQELILESIQLLFGDDKRYASKVEEIQLKKVDTKERKTDAETVKILTATGCFTKNEIRKFMNYDELPVGGDEMATGVGGANFTLGQDDIEKINKLSASIKNDYEAQ
ncbi:phage portal protein, partial [Candidatus Gracilibacteria bacterium]